MMKELVYGKTRCYLLDNGGQSVLVDTDWAGTLPLFFRALKEAGGAAGGYSVFVAYALPP